MFLRNNVYRSKTVQLASDAISRENVVINDDCKVKAGTELINAVIGKNCKIGRNCVLENAYVFDDVEIGDKCILKNCVIGRKTKIHEKSAINNGSVIGNGCVIPQGNTIDKQFIVAKAGTDEYDEGIFQTRLFYYSIVITFENGIFDYTEEISIFYCLSLINR